MLMDNQIDIDSRHIKILLFICNMLYKQNMLKKFFSAEKLWIPNIYLSDFY